MPANTSQSPCRRPSCDTVLLANPNFELRTGCQVQRVNLDSMKKQAIGVTYIDAVGREFEQPAGLVITSRFAINTIQMRLASRSSMAVRQNYADLDPTYQDAWGPTLLRITFDFPKNDLRMASHVTAKAVEIGKAMGANQVVGNPRRGPYTVTQYQTTDNTGGSLMGHNPRNSSVNRYLQSWDVPNVFVMSASTIRKKPLGTPVNFGRTDLLGNRCAEEPVP